jgi:hypothetical protein
MLIVAALVVLLLGNALLIGALVRVLERATLRHLGGLPGQTAQERGITCGRETVHERLRLADSRSRCCYCARAEAAQRQAAFWDEVMAIVEAAEAGIDGHASAMGPEGSR